MTDWTRLIRDIADFPKPGIAFKDITPVLADAGAFAAAVDALATPWRATPPQAVVGIEARGFILGAAMARALGCGFVPVRKPGKLPARVIAQDVPMPSVNSTSSPFVRRIARRPPPVTVDRKRAPRIAVCPQKWRCLKAAYQTQHSPSVGMVSSSAFRYSRKSCPALPSYMKGSEPKRTFFTKKARPWFWKLGA
jgi:hypothetical protein